MNTETLLKIEACINIIHGLRKTQIKNTKEIKQTVESLKAELEIFYRHDNEIFTLKTNLNKKYEILNEMNNLCNKFDIPDFNLDVYNNEAEKINQDIKNLGGMNENQKNKIDALQKKIDELRSSMQENKINLLYNLLIDTIKEKTSLFEGVDNSFLFDFSIDGGIIFVEIDLNLNDYENEKINVRGNLITVKDYFENPEYPDCFNIGNLEFDHISDGCFVAIFEIIRGEQYESY